jgi:hypothetical protein
MDVNYNTQCYTFKKIIYTEGFLDDSVDATYIIHLKDNGRLEHIYEQLKIYQPTKIVYLIYNEGFKNCKKKLIEQISYQDLTDAFLQCFKHANNNNYNNILILEDDFIFNSNIKNRETLQNINHFLNKYKETQFIYYLGCNPIFIIPYTLDLKHYKSYKSCSTHSIIYSKKTRQTNLNLYLKHWDVIMENNIKNRYLYYIPLCYQTYPDTENKETWVEKDNIVIFYIKKKSIQILNLDKFPEPGFTIIYTFSKLLFVIISILIIYLLYKYLFIFYLKNKNKHKHK